MKSKKIPLFHPAHSCRAYTYRHQTAKQKGIGMLTTRDEPFNPDYIPKCRTLRESECRAAATYLCNPLSPWVVHPCKLETCRLQQVCAGPTRPSEFSKDFVFGMTGDGIGTCALTELPVCATDGNADFCTRFEAMRQRLREALSEEADPHWVAVAEIMKAFRWNKPGWLRAQLGSAERP